MIDWDNLPARVPMIDGPSLSNQLMETFIDRYRADFYLIRLLGLPNQPCELMRDLMVFLPEGDLSTKYISNVERGFKTPNTIQVQPDDMISFAVMTTTAMLFARRYMVMVSYTS